MAALSAALHCILRAVPPPTRESTLPAWQLRLRQLAGEWPDTAARALLGGANADCVAFAFAAGYQAALDRMLGPAPGAPFRALCVTEREGNRPRNIRTTLRRAGSGWRLDGEKSYVTGGAAAGQLCIAARLDESPWERPELRMVCVPAERAGIRIDTLPALPYLTELPHAAVALAGVEVAADEVLGGDGYDRYVKPFRTIEDIHVELALLGLLVARLHGLDGRAEWVERLLAAIGCLSAAARLDPLDPAAHLLLAGNRATLQPLLEELDSAWAQADPVFHANWQRDRRLLGVAHGARSMRTQRAREQFCARGAPST